MHYVVFSNWYVYDFKINVKHLFKKQVCDPAENSEQVPTHLLLPGFLSLCWDWLARENKMKSALCHSIFYENNTFKRTFVPGRVTLGT